MPRPSGLDYDRETIEPVKYDNAQLSNSEIFLNCVIVVFGIGVVVGLWYLVRLAI